MGDKNKEKKLIVVTFCLLVILAIIALLIIKAEKPSQSALNAKDQAGKQTPAVRQKNEDKAILQSDGNIQKVQISTGKIEQANSLEQENFTDFAGFPKLGIENGKDLEQMKTLSSFDKSKAIVTIATYDANAIASANGPQETLSSADYLCEINKKSCQLTELLSQSYDGLPGDLQKKNSDFAWSGWDSTKNILLGNLSLNDSGQSSPVYVCDIAKKSCTSTIGFDSQKEGDAHAAVPNGAFSPDLNKFVMISQHDVPNLETGKNWELLLYSTTDLTKPTRSHDLSMIIDRDEKVAYDSVQSVSWSGDEKKIAIGTSRKIFMFDLESGSTSLAYVAPSNENGDYYWDASSLYLTPDAKYIAFVDSPELASDQEDVQQNDEESTNVLKKIDLENGNKVTSMYSGKGLALKF